MPKCLGLQTYYRTITLVYNYIAQDTTLRQSVTGERILDFMRLH